MHRTRRPFLTLPSWIPLAVWRTAASVLLAWAVSLPINQALAEAVMLDPPRAQSMTSDGALTIVDIRRPDEWRATGMPAKSEGATVSFGRGDQKFLARIRAITKGDRDAPLALICARGVRSAYAAELLHKHGYTRVYDIAEGVLGSEAGPGWLERRLPVEPCRAC